MASGPTTLLNTVTLPEMTDLVRHEWTYVKEFGQRNAQQLFITDNIGEGNGPTKRYDEIDVETYANVKTEGANSAKAQTGVGYNVTMTARTFSKEIEITVEQRKYNRYQEVGSYITELAHFCPNRMDLDLTHRLTFASSTSYTDMDGETVSTTVGDGLALASASHTLAFSSTTYSNRVSGDPAFSETGLEAAMLLGATNIYSNFGEKRTLNFNTIVTGNDPSTVRTVRQLLESTADVDASQSGVANTYSGAFRHVMLKDMATTAAGAYDTTKRRYWFLAATGQGMMGWQAYLGVWQAPKLLTPSDTNNGMDIHNYNWTYSTYCMYGIATVSPKGIICSLVSG